jgi:hypothetical protein
MIDAIPKKAYSRFISTVPRQSYERLAALSVLCDMHTLGIPLGITYPEKPNLS